MNHLMYFFLIWSLQYSSVGFFVRVVHTLFLLPYMVFYFFSFIRLLCFGWNQNVNSTKINFQWNNRIQLSYSLNKIQKKKLRNNHKYLTEDVYKYPMHNGLGMLQYHCTNDLQQRYVRWHVFQNRFNDFHP